jgi:cytochrome c-type biogenesis protein CcmF
MAFTPFRILLGLLLPLGSILPWKRGKLSKSFRVMRPWLALSVALAALVWAMQTGRSALGPLGVFMGVWIVSGALVDLWSRTGKSGAGRLLRLPRADWGKAVAHAGLGVTFFAICGLVAWKTDDIRVAQVGEAFDVGAFILVLDDVQDVRGPNYLSTMGFVTLSRDGRELAQLRPEKRIYPVAQMPTTEAGIDYRFLRDVYVVIGDQQDNGGWVVRTYIKPFANWMWGGALLMALGGALSLSDRRFRVAAGAARRIPQGTPAE